ncbi:alcohol dehydrogenase catalytic domain-containing protein [Catenulispora subtropica]|uniref:alcohol dehydrogenase n=1 Tax=Catenulispora subtropica TaxID=450798 RepID=A0ABN2T6Z7_9ACTN
MRANVVPAPGENWVPRDVPAPEPGPGEVLVQVHASGICHNDLLVSRGALPFPRLDPVITGHEAAGRVAAVGPGVLTREVGDRVGVTWAQGTCGRCDYCRRNLPLTGQSMMSCAAPVMTGITAPGVHADYVAVRAESTVLLPEKVACTKIAPMMCAGYTALSALRAAEARPGQRVAVVGIGGIGHLALQFAKAFGHETVAVTRSPDKAELCEQFGADLVVADGAGLRAAGGADVVLVTGTSNAAAADALPAVAPDGVLVLASIDPSELLTVPAAAVQWARRQRIVGATHGGLDVLAEALALQKAGKVTPMVEVFAPEQAAEAVERLAKGEVRFRAVVEYDPH